VTSTKRKSIKIKPANKGKLTSKVGKKGLATNKLEKTKTKAKESGNTTLEREATFALNAKKWNHK
jgi:hypothetical protein